MKKFAGILALWLLIAGPLFAAFGLTSTTDFYTVDTGANLVFKVRRTDNGSSTQSAGDIASLVYNGTEYQNTSKGSQINSGFDFLYNGVSAVTVSAAVVNTDFIKVTVVAGNLTHYYMARNGFPQIYMATHFTTEPDTLGLCRFIVRIPSALLPNGPVPSDIRNNTGAIESGDIFGMADGTTRSKHYSNMRLKDWSYIGATGTGVGMWMLRSNHEGDSGGPFYRSLLMQTGTDQEITYIINYGEAQTEAFRTNILNGPYVLSFTNGAAPTAPDTSWVANMGLTGFVGTAGRGGVSATGITGRDAAYAYTVGFANSTAQYWTDAATGNGVFTKTDMLPGTYTMKVYKNELAVYSAEVTVNAGVTTALGTLAIAADPSTTVPFWRIGNWDGTPNEFLNGDKVTTMHPSDVRMASWNPGPYVIGSSTPATGMPCYQWKDVGGGSQAIEFQLTAGQLVNSTVRVGLTCAFEGARPKIALNSWTYPTNPTASTQPDTRTLTVGTYRGNNVTYTFAVPSSALVAGTNTLWVFPISGSGSTGYLSAGYSIDSIDFHQGGAQTLPLPAGPSNLIAAVGNAQVSLSWNAVSGAATYTVQRATVSGGPYVTLASGIATTGYTDTAVSSGVPYYYVVRSTNSSGTGDPSAEASATPLPPLPMAHLRFDESSGTVAADSSGNGWNGTLVNEAAWATGASGKINNAIALDGTNDHVTLPANIVGSLNDFTMAAWVKWNGGNDWQRAFDFGTGTTNYLFLTPRSFFGTTRFAIRTPAVGEQILNGPALTVGAWTHVAVTLSGTTSTLYINGASVGTNGTMTLKPSSLGSTTNNYLGKSQFVADAHLNGSLDEFQIHNRALSAAEVAALASPPPAPAGLVATAGNAEVALSWNAAPGAIGYHVKRATTSGGPFATIAPNLTSTAFTDTTTANGTTYYYVVTAINTNAESSNSAPASATPLAPPPVVHLRFDESSGTSASDSSGNGWNGTLVNGPLWATGANGKINNAVALDGSNDHLTLPTGVVSSLNDFTIAVWVKWNGGTDWQRAIDFGTGTNNYLFLSPRSGGATTRFAIRTPAVAEQIIDGPPLATGVWTHVAVTLSGNTGTLYLNGASVGTNALMTLKPSSLGSTTLNYLGKSQFIEDANMNGSLDELQIHNRALSASEIAALASPPPAPTGLVATAGNAQVALTWNAAAGATGYHVKRATVSGGPFTTIASNLAITAYTDTAVTNGTSYHYVVTAVATVAESARSTQASATPLSALQAWRLANFGSFENTGNAADHADPDGDGTLNETEFRLGLDPNNGSSFFKATGAKAPTGFELTWPTAAGLTFEIRRSTSLEGTWELIGTVSSGTFTDTNAPSGTAFYRIVLLP